MIAFYLGNLDYKKTDFDNMSTSISTCEQADPNHNTLTEKDDALNTVTKMCSDLVLGGEEKDSSLIKFALDELGETDEKRETALSQLRSLISQNSSLKGCCNKDASMRLDDPKCKHGTRFLLRFLRLHRFDEQKAAAQMESYLKMKWESPQWHTELEPKEGKRFLELLENGFIFVSPGRDKMGRKVLVVMNRYIDPTRHTAADEMKAVMSTLETLLIMDEETQIRGLSYVFYFKNLKFSQVFIWSPSDAGKMLLGCDNNLPIRHRNVIVSDTPFGMGVVIEFGKSFLREELRSAIQVVPDATKIKKASDGVFDCPDILPSEIIGDEGKYTAREMAALWKDKVIEHGQHLKILDDLVVEKEEKVPDTETEQTSNKSWFSWR